LSLPGRESPLGRWSGHGSDRQRPGESRSRLIQGAHAEEVKFKQDARALKRKALSSMRAAMAAFNSPHDDGRVTDVLLRLQHAFEMLLKAALVQGGRSVFDKKTGRSIGFEAAIRQCQQLGGLKVTDEEAGTLRAVDAMRDDEQHWLTEVDEGLLYLHARASVTLFDDVLHKVFGERLADHLPLRVLPISVDPPQDFVTLVDREYANVAALLQPGRRATSAARAKLRALLAMEAHVDPDAQVSVSDVNRVEKGVKAGKSRDQVFPRLGEIGAAVSGQGLDVQVRFVQHGGVPLRLVKDDAVDAAAFREVDLQKKYHRPPTDLANALGITTARAAALRAHLGVDDEDDCRHVFVFGSQRHTRYSDNAFTRMRDAVTAVDMDAVWAAHAPARRGKTRLTCTQPGCAHAKRLRATAS